LRFGVSDQFTDVAAMLDAIKPDIVHITTPAQSHASLAIQCLNAGSHVYLEKPFSLDLAECEQILTASNAAGKQVCIGHDQLFDPLWLSLRERVNSGEIGQVRHVESVLGYPISGNFGRQVVNNDNHWVRKLPGGLFQNTISHPLYRITDFMLDASPQINAHWRSSEGRDFPTELDVSFVGESVTGQLHFATNIPAQRISRVYGERGTLEYDPDNLVIRKLQSASLPGAFAKIEIPWKQFREGTGNLISNLIRFSRSEIHYFSGMRLLFAEFYRATLSGGDLPIPYSEIRRTVSILDEIFDQCHENCRNNKNAKVGAAHE